MAVARARRLLLLPLLVVVVALGTGSAVVLLSEGSAEPADPEAAPTSTRPEVGGDGISVADHGATGDDGSDDTAAFRDAIRAAAAAGTWLEVPAGTHILSGELVLPDGLAEVRLADGAVLRQTADDPVFARRGEIRAGPLTTSGASPGADVVTVPDAGDVVEERSWIVIASTTAVHRSKNLMLGSLRQVTRVDGGSVSLDRALHRDLTEGTSGWVVDLAPPVVIRGGVVEHADPEEAFQPLVLFEWVESPRVEGTEVRSCGGSGVKAVGTRGGALDVYVHDCLDDHSGRRFDSGRHYGYGVEVAGPARDLAVTGRAHAVRHAFTTGSSYPNVDERLENVGEPENIDVSMEVWDTTSSGLDTHELGIDVRFHDCTVRDAGRYARDGSTDGKEGGFGIFIRSPRTTVERCQITGAAVSGIVVSEPAEGIAAWDRDHAVRIVDTTISGTEGRSAIQLKQPTIVRDVTITGSHLFGIQFFRDGEASTVRNTTIDLDGDERTIAFVNPGDAALRDNTLRTDVEQLG